MSNVFVPPPSGEYPWRPLRENDRMGGGRMNAPIVVALLLSIVLFILFLWFFLSPLFRRDPLRALPRPIDLEDAYFIDENTSRASPFPPSPTLIPKPPFRTMRPPIFPRHAVHSPPPAYTSRPSSPTYPTRAGTLRGGRDAAVGARGDGPARQSSFRRLLALPGRLLTRSASAPVLISKPIPLPEFPLPGPEVLTEAEARQRAAEADTTIVRECASPPRSVSASTSHLPAAYLPSPSQAEVHLRDAPSRPASQCSSDILSTSVRYPQAPRVDSIAEADTSIRYSRIGLAF